MLQPDIRQVHGPDDAVDAARDLQKQALLRDPLDPGLPRLADRSEEVLRALVAADVWPTRLAREGESLESFFLSVVGGERS